VVSLLKAQAGEVVAPGAVIARVFDPASLMIRFQVPRDRRRDLAAGTQVELTVAGADRPLRARVTSVSSDLEPPLDFAVGEADILDANAARDVQIGTLGEVRVVDRVVDRPVDRPPVIADTSTRAVIASRASRETLRSQD
jgi:hypothetical protein